MGPARALADARGFTLAELLVVCALAGFVLAGVLSLVMAGNQSYVSGANQVQAQQTARLAIQRMMQEVRGAGYNPRNAAFSAVTGQSATGFTLQNDWNGNGVIDPGIVVADPVNGLARGERVVYSLASGTLTRQESGVDAAPAILGTGVQNMTLEYRDAGDALTSVSASIRTVVLNLTTQPQTQTAAALGRAEVVMIDRARIRNR